MFWLYGTIIFLLGRTFYAGLRSKDLFYREPEPWKTWKTGRHVCEDKVSGYVFRTLAVSVTWPISLPLIGIFVLGQKFNRKEV